MKEEENNLRERVLPKEYANLVERYRCLGAENKELREINNNLRESLEFATGFCKKCDETACPVRKSLQRARGEGETKCVAKWCETVPISAFTIYWWIREKGREYAEQRTSEAIAAWNRRVEG